jgi:hypothetical protein
MTEPTQQLRPNIQIDNIMREATEEEYENLLALGWKPEPTEPEEE